MNLIGALQRLVDPFHDRRHAVGRIKALVRIHLSGEIRIRRDLPAAQINRFQSRFHLLHGLVAGERAERGNKRLRSAADPRASPRRGGPECVRGRRCLANAARRLTNRSLDPSSAVSSSRSVHLLLDAASLHGISQDFPSIELLVAGRVRNSTKLSSVVILSNKSRAASNLLVAKRSSPTLYLPVLRRARCEIVPSLLCVHRQPAARMANPLPNLRARDFRRRRIFHQVENRHCAVTAQPGFQILHADADVRCANLLR